MPELPVDFLPSLETFRLFLIFQLPRQAVRAPFGARRRRAPAGGCLLRCPSGCVIEIESVIHYADVWTRRDKKDTSRARLGRAPTQAQVCQQPNLIDAVTHDAVF
jgi:hypothetical protein